MRAISYPQCSKDGYHKGECLNQVCLNKDCSKQEFLMCNICSTEDHKDHKQKPIKVLMSEILQKVEKDQHSQDEPLNQEEIFGFIEMNKQNMISEFRESINSVIQQSQLLESQYVQFFDKLKESLMDLTNGITNEQILQVIDQIQNSEYDLSDFKEKIRKLLQFQPVFVTKQGKELPMLDNQDLKDSMSKAFDSIQKQIIKKNEEIEQIMEKQNQVLQSAITDQVQTKKIFYQLSLLDYLFVKHTKSTSLITHEEGIEYETKGSTQLIYSQQTFTTGVHGYTMQLVNFKENTSSCFLIGVYEEQDAKNNKNTGNHPWSCLFNGCRGNMKPENQNFGQYLKKKDILKIKMDIEANTYTVTDGKEQLTYYMVPNKYILKGKKLKFFVSFYSSDCQVRLRFIETY